MNNNVAYIDGSNLHNAVRNYAWEFDYARFRVWLKHKYHVGNAYIFLGMISKHTELYNYLQQCGYILIFKDVIYDTHGKAKGNCDADIVVHAMQGAYENDFDKMILVSSDGDYSPLIKFMISKNKMHTVLSPYETKKCSVLIKRTGVKIAYVDEQKNVLEKEKAPDIDKTMQGSLS
jgi:uncharacterized LabA/DUF88 family protein